MSIDIALYFFDRFTTLETFFEIEITDHVHIFLKLIKFGLSLSFMFFFVS